MRPIDIVAVVLLVLVILIAIGCVSRCAYLYTQQQALLTPARHRATDTDMVKRETLQLVYQNMTNTKKSYTLEAMSKAVLTCTYIPPRYFESFSAAERVVARVMIMDVITEWKPQ